MVLQKRYRRSIKDNLSFYISSTILTIVTLLMFYLFNIAGNGINQFGDEFFQRNHLEDANFSTYLPISEEELENLEEEYQVTLEAQSYQNLKEDDFTARVFQATDKLDCYEVTGGRDIASNGEMLISEGYAVNMDVAIGDHLTIRGKSYEVVGYFQRPDYLYMLEQPDDSYKNVSSFFLAYFSEEDFNALGEAPVQYLVQYEKNNSDEFRKAINETYLLQNYLSADENPRITMVHEQADMFLVMSYIVLIVMPLIAVALICIILSRKVKSEQKMIGTLSALGYSKGKLMAHYAGFAVIPGLLGGILTCIITVIFQQPYGEMSLSDYEPMHATFRLSPWVGLLGILVPTLMYLCAALLAVSRLLRHDTVEMLNGTAGQKKHKHKFFVGKAMPVKRKFALRSLLGNPARSAVILLGIFLGSFIMLFMFSIVDAFNYVAETVEDNLGTYSYEYILTTLETGVPEEGEPVLAGSFEDENQDSIPVYGVDSDNPYLQLKDKDGTSLSVENGCYVTSVSAYLLGIEGGDSVTLYNPLTLEDISLKIDGIVENDMQEGIFLSREKAGELLELESDTYNAILSDKALDLDSASVSKTIRIDAIKEQCDTMLDEMGMIIYLGAALGAIICIAAIYVAVNMLITENRINISMLKVLGYSNNRINAMVLSANHILLPIGIAISIPVVYLLLAYYMKWFAGYIGMIISPHFSIKSCLLVILAVSLCYFGSVYRIRTKTGKIDMVESLKDNRE